MYTYILISAHAEREREREREWETESEKKKRQRRDRHTHTHISFFIIYISYILVLCYFPRLYVVARINKFKVFVNIYDYYMQVYE